MRVERTEAAARRLSTPLSYQLDDASKSVAADLTEGQRLELWRLVKPSGFRDRFLDQTGRLPQVLCLAGAARFERASSNEGRRVGACCIGLLCYAPS